MLRRLATAICVSLAASAISAAPTANPVIPLDGADWRLAPDPKNVGVAEKWYEAPRPEAKSAKVPGLIQDVFPGYAGAAWYWLDVVIPANPHEAGRYLLRFWDVDYLADVWVNGTHIGRHEGAQAKFTFDATAAVKPGAVNRIAVRVLSPFNEPIDGLTRGQTPHGAFVWFSLGGIVDSVEMIMAPQIRIDDLFVRADPKTGKICVEAAVCNESKDPVRGSVEFKVSPAASGEPVCAATLSRASATRVRARARVR